MREGFYAIHIRAGDDEEGAVLLAHLKGGVLVAVDPGGCSLTGTYAIGTEGVAIDGVYAFKPGTELMTGQVLPHGLRHQVRVTVSDAMFDGEPTTVNIGFGPSKIWAERIAEPVA